MSAPNVQPYWHPDRRAPGGGVWMYPEAPPIAPPQPFDTRPPYQSPASAALKNGFRTSEFWITALAIVAPPLLDYIGPTVSTIAGPWGAVAAGVYALARGAIKLTAVLRRGPVIPPAGWGVSGAPPYVQGWTPPAASNLKDAPPAYESDEDAVNAGWPAGRGI